MEEYFRNGYYVSDDHGIVHAWSSTSEPLPMIVDAIMRDHAQVYVDVPNFLLAGRPATWIVTHDGTLGAPVWTRLDQDQAKARAQGLRRVEPQVAP